MNGNSGSSWTAKAMTAAGTLVVVAVAGRLVWEILSPLAGYLLVIAIVGAALLKWSGRNW